MIAFTDFNSPSQDIDCCSFHAPLGLYSSTG